MIMNVILPIAVFIFGLMIGSFLNVCIYRIPRKESIVFPSSHCPSCGKEILFRDNIPIIGYIVLKGRCRFCSAKISIRYPIIELLTALFLLLLFFKYGVTLDYLRFAFFICVLIVISAVDIEHLVIPNRVIVPAIAVGLLFSIISGYQILLESLIGIAVGGGLLLVIGITAPLVFKQESLGGGDIKLAAFMGIFLGPFVLMALFWGFFVGAFIGLMLMARKDKSLKDAITFGPFLSVGSVITLFFGSYFWKFYVGLL